MGIAYNAPGNGRARWRYVSSHAVGRLRERADAEGHLDDDFLGRVLDDAVERAYAAGRNENVLDERGEPADLVDLKDCFDDLLVRGEVFALVKANDRRDSRYKEAIVTVVGDKAAAGIREQTKEAKLGKEPFNPALSSELAGVVEVKKSWIDPANCGSGCGGAGEDCGSPECSPREYLVLTACVDGTSEPTPSLTRAEAVARAKKNPENVRIYRLVPFRIEVKLEED